MKLREVQVMPLIYTQRTDLIDIIALLQDSISYLEAENRELRKQLKPKVSPFLAAKKFL